jgi:protein-tyrosine-phosphatase
MAEALLAKALKQESCALEVVGAGLFSSGQGADEKAILAMEKIGIDLHGYKSKKLTQDAVNEAAMVLCMTKEQLDSFRKLFDNVPGHCYLLREFLGSEDRDIKDPFGCDLETYINVRNSISEAIPSIVNFLKEELNDN